MTPIHKHRQHLFDVLAANERSQAWLARKVGCSESYISLIKNGRRPVPTWFADRASTVLGLPRHVLFFDAELSTESEPHSAESTAAHD